MINQTRKNILFEVDQPKDLSIILGNAKLLPYTCGLWYIVITPNIVTFTDDHSIVGYYSLINSAFYNFKSLKVDNIDYTATYSIPDARSEDSSFYFDLVTTRLYIHFADFEPPLDKNLLLGIAITYTWGNISNPYLWDGTYSEQRISALFPLVKSIDPLFWGLLSFESNAVTLINNDGNLDDWRSRNLYLQAARFLIGDDGDAYLAYKTIYQGFVSNDTRKFDEFTVTLQDPRAALVQPLCINTFTIAQYPYINPDNAGRYKPIAYGKIYDAECVCVNETETTPAYYTFFLSDIEWYPITSLDQVYVNGVPTAYYSVNLTAGTFQMTAASVVNNLSNVTAQFTATAIQNGVEIIKDLMLKYNGTSYVASLWDLTEVALASASALNTSVYINTNEAKLYDVLTQICVDLDARFFQHDNGLWTIRLYDQNRAVKATTGIILQDEWIGEPEIVNNADQFLTSVTINYKKEQKDGGYAGVYTNTSYKTATYAIFKAYQETVINTNLVTEAAAIAKSNTILNISSNPQDIIQRSVSINHDDIEICDFIIASPSTRFNQTPVWGIYEVMATEKNYENMTFNYSLRYVRVPVLADFTTAGISPAYTGTFETVLYKFRILSDGDYRVTSEGNTRIIGE